MSAENKQVTINRSGNGISQMLHLTNARDVGAGNINQLDLQSAPDNIIKTRSGENSKRLMRGGRANRQTAPTLAKRGHNGSHRRSDHDKGGRGRKTQQLNEQTNRVQQCRSNEHNWKRQRTSGKQKCDKKNGAGQANALGL